MNEIMNAKRRLKPDLVNKTINRFPGDASHKAVSAGVLRALDGVPYDDPKDREAVRDFYDGRTYDTSRVKPGG